MIRPIRIEDTPDLIEIARGTEVFKPIELVALREVLDDYHAVEHANGHVAISFERHGKVLGFAYYAPASMTDRTWYLYWIAVEKGIQAKGIGTELLRKAEEDIDTRRGRLLLIETSSLPHYELTRRFYEKHGYRRACTIEDFYSDHDDLIVFGKRLDPREPAS
ncbi:GNAT family N-acetyltransferase [Singulisphaera sp. PoT]|uniref:GNAT family N-acetyltransferase n=1 Tax=Singulisphaera sp. PoT TaxID=3411797 RepID=UPI003BF5D91F